MLYPIQQAKLKLAGEQVLLAFDVGCGKTITAIYHYLKWRRSEDTPLIILAPKAKVIEQGWDRTIEQVCAEEGVKINYEVLTTDAIKKLTLRQVLYSAFILDECHMFKGQSQRGIAFVSLMEQCLQSVCLLSATPASNGWEDCLNYFAGFGHTDVVVKAPRSKKLTFNKSYATYGLKEVHLKGGKTRSYMAVQEYHNTDVLLNKFKRFTLPMSADEIGELPERTFQDVQFAKPSTYNAIRKHRVRKLPDGTLDKLDTPSKLSHALRQVSAPQEKVDYLEVILESTKKNVLVAYVYTEHAVLIKKMCEKIGKRVYEISGNVKDIPKKDITDSVVLVQYQAGGAGIELQMCDITVLFTPTFSFQDYVQLLGRNYGGFRQVNHVHVYRFVCDGLEKSVYYEALDEKKDFSEQLFFERSIG